MNDTTGVVAIGGDVPSRIFRIEHKKNGKAVCFSCLPAIPRPLNCQTDNPICHAAEDEVAKTKPNSIARKAKAPVAMHAGVGGRIAATLSAAAAAGLTAGSKGKRISGRAHDRLFEAAAERSGLKGSELIEYALAKVALEDDFAAKLLAREGKVGRDVDLEF